MLTVAAHTPARFTIRSYNITRRLVGTSVLSTLDVVLVYPLPFIPLTAGFVAVNLADKFKHVVGLDPSSKMVQAGVQPDSSARIDYRVGNAEDLVGAGIEEQSVDLVVAGTSRLARTDA